MTNQGSYPGTRKPDHAAVAPSMIDIAARTNHGTDLSNAEYVWVLGRIEEGCATEPAVAECIADRANHDYDI